MNRLFRNLIASCLLFFSILTISAQNISLKKVEPPTWWVGMASSNLQLLVYGENISLTKPVIDYEGVTVSSVSTVQSPNYLFINLEISKTAKPGNFKIQFNNAKRKKLVFDYQLKTKKQRNITGQTVDASDVLYLITPDRFANGDVSNDSTDDTLEKANRSDEDGRHGGDLRGVIDQFDYIKDLGITTLWLNPVLENDQPKFSYHGYGISDFYKTDTRFGTNEDFKALVDLSHQNNMKVIMDQVLNHCGSGHWWMNDLPSPDWLNQWETFTRSNFTNIVASDPHVSQSDYDLLTKGWFDTNLPDLNLENKLLAMYLIQNSIWWIEYSGIDGIRMDTYPYPDKYVMAQWNKTVKTEYPNFYIVGETWESKASSLSYWNKKEANSDGYSSNLNSVSDYPLYYATVSAFKKNGDIFKIYETLAEDFIYGDASNNKIFAGNHDQGRIYSLLNEDFAKFKLSMAFILTTRGIPQLYYGDEILLKGDKPDGNLRKDFMGGWASDDRNAFAQKGRTAQENDAYTYIRTILNWRKTASEIHRGKLMHYQPINNIYVYFRYTDTENTMIILNNSDTTIDEFNLDRYKKSFNGYTSGTDIITKTHFKALKSLKVAANSALIIKLEK
ncbi:MAG: glycoside hydrolase family 13 protein [Vicingaceae bacterium]|nr:glycoside hydrolase family 13 protein [Vicingaceae bacterium]